MNAGFYDAKEVQCLSCHSIFNPQKGRATEQTVISQTGKQYKIKELLENTNVPPKHRLYAIMAVNPQGEKIYLTPTQFDHELFQQAQQDFHKQARLIPTMNIRDGYNTKQAIGYGYQFWHQFFNERQLLCLSIY